MLHAQCRSAAWMLIYDITSGSCVEVRTAKQHLNYCFTISVSQNDILPNADVLRRAAKQCFVPHLTVRDLRGEGQLSRICVCGRGSPPGWQPSSRGFLRTTCLLTSRLISHGHLMLGAQHQVAGSSRSGLTNKHQPRGLLRFNAVSTHNRHKPSEG
jgi:hypothetical protein